MNATIEYLTKVFAQKNLSSKNFVLRTDEWLCACIQWFWISWEILKRRHQLCNEKFWQMQGLRNMDIGNKCLLRGKTWFNIQYIRSFQYTLKYNAIFRNTCVENYCKNHQIMHCEKWKECRIRSLLIYGSCRKITFLMNNRFTCIIIETFISYPLA